jgi:hypothetical protein
MQEFHFSMVLNSLFTLENLSVYVLFIGIELCLQWMHFLYVFYKVKLGHRQGVDMTRYIVNDTGNPRKRDIDSNKLLSFSNFYNFLIL